MTIMPFGKYAGVALGEIPPPYLRWVIKNADLYRYPGLGKAIKSIIAPSTKSPGSVPNIRPSKSEAVCEVKFAGPRTTRDLFEQSTVGDPVLLEPEPTNSYDPFAIRLINQVLVSKGIDRRLDSYQDNIAR